MAISVLLLQARRQDDPCLHEEHQSFAGKAGLRPEQITCHDLLQGPPSLRRVKQFDALMIGGSGDYSVSENNLPELEALQDLLCEICEIGHPTYASCFGFHCLVAGLGGEIVFDPSNTEVGTYRLRLTEAGKQDPLLGTLPPEFNAQLGHKDRAAALPPGIDNLAASKLSPIQAFRIPGKPIWASQFHPELDAETNRHRFLTYMAKYGGVMTENEKLLALQRFRESPATHSLLRRFLRLVFQDSGSSSTTSNAGG